MSFKPDMFAGRLINEESLHINCLTFYFFRNQSRLQIFNNNMQASSNIPAAKIYMLCMCEKFSQV